VSRIAHLSFLLWITAMPLLATGQASRTRLHPSAEVRTEMIHLSDLLPSNAPDTLVQLASAVLIGRSPRAGCARLLERDAVERLLPTEIRRSVEIPPEIVIRRMGWPIPVHLLKAAVQDFLSDSGSSTENVAEGSLHWPSQIDASVEEPELKVTSARWDSLQGTLDFHMRCADRDVCGNFLVQAVIPRPQNGETSSGVFPQPVRVLVTAKLPVLATPGRPAMLVLENQGVRISMPAICLERGVLHQRIRARELRGSRTFRAEVVGPNQLRASF
jgi:hypothetical protein